MLVIDQEEYLAHYGVPGMKWGKRKAKGVNVKEKAKRGDFKSRSKGQKALLISGGIAGWYAAGKLTEKLLKDKMPMTQLAVATVTTVVGVRVTRQLLDQHGDKKLSEMPSH